MKGLFKSLFAKITLTFFVLLLILAFIQMYLSLNCTFDYYAQKSQAWHAQSAANLSKILQPHLKHSALPSAKTDSLIRALFLINPQVHLFFLDQRGNIRAHYPQASLPLKSRIPLEPIRSFLSPDRHLPLLNDDPLSAGAKTVFSVSPIRVNGQPGYVYVTFTGMIDKISPSTVWGNPVIRNTAMLAVLSTLFSLLAGMVLFFFLTRRIKEMNRIVQRFEQGHYRERVPVVSDDEVGELAQTFNHMAAKFENHVKQLKENDRLRRELMANISHDLRSPLASVQGYVETILMKDEHLTSEERKRFLEISLKNLIHLNNLVRELFDLTKFDARQIKPNPEPFSLAELVQDIVLKFEPQARTNRIQLLTRFSTHLPLVVADIGMIERALSNLIQNAIHYGKAQGTVLVQLMQENDKVKVIVCDDGPGIPDDDLPHIFDRFYRVDKSRTRNAASSGLGLAIVKKIISAHDEKIYAESTAGQGSVFYFYLPVWQNQSPTPAKPVSR